MMGDRVTSSLGAGEGKDGNDLSVVFAASAKFPPLPTCEVGDVCMLELSSIAGDSYCTSPLPYPDPLPRSCPWSCAVRPNSAGAVVVMPLKAGADSVSLAPFH